MLDEMGKRPRGTPGGRFSVSARAGTVREGKNGMRQRYAWF